jgi:hypothetical protein
LTGAPFAEGTANVYRVLPGVSTQIFRSGFKTIIDIAFGPDGSLYVLQYATGAVFFSGPGSDNPRPRLTERLRSSSVTWFSQPRWQSTQMGCSM